MIVALLVIVLLVILAPYLLTAFLIAWVAQHWGVILVCAVVVFLGGVWLSSLRHDKPGDNPWRTP